MCVQKSTYVYISIYGAERCGKSFNVVVSALRHYTADANAALAQQMVARKQKKKRNRERHNTITILKRLSVLFAHHHCARVYVSFISVVLLAQSIVILRSCTHTSCAVKNHIILLRVTILLIFLNISHYILLLCEVNYCFLCPNKRNFEMKLI